MACSLLFSSRNRFAFTVVRLTACVLGLLSFATQANAQIELDFRHDNGFFSGNAEATAALEAAVADINAVLDLNLSRVSDTASGTSGAFSVTFDFEYNYLNPSTNAQETLANTALAANQIRIFVGSQSLGVSTNALDVLGEGGPGGIAFSVVAEIYGEGGSLQAAINNAEANDTHRRGDGPLVAQLMGAFDSGESFSIEVGPTIGTLQFDDDDAINWHFNHLTEVQPGEIDFYTVALHETLHAIGIGTSETFRSLAGGSNWLGNEVIDVNGTGIGIIEPGDGSHFTEGLMSTRISDGVLQEIVMDPSLQIGNRKALTQLDVAALRDLGFSTIVPDVALLGDVNLDGAVTFLDIGLFVTILTMNNFQVEADLNRDGNVNFLDIGPFVSVLTAG